MNKFSSCNNYLMNTSSTESYIKEEPLDLKNEYLNENNTNYESVNHQKEVPEICSDVTSFVKPCSGSRFESFEVKHEISFDEVHEAIAQDNDYDMQAADINIEDNDKLVKDQSHNNHSLMDKVINRKIRMSSLRSKIWYHFTKREGKGKCRYCQMQVSMSGRSSTGNLKRHLRFKHPTVSLALESVNSNRIRSRSRPNGAGKDENFEDGMSSRENDIWYHFSKAEGKGKCRYCQSEVAMSGGRSIGNLRRHLKFKHPTVFTREDVTANWAHSRSPSTGSGDDHEYSEERNVTSRPQSEPNSSLSGSSASPLIIPGPSRLPHLSPLSSANPSSPMTRVQCSMSHFVDIIKPMSLNKSRSIDVQLLKMVCKGFQPFSVVEDEEFKKFIKLLCPSYTLPSPKILSKGLLPSIHNGIIEKLKAELINTTAVCLTCDGWTNINNVSFYALTVHYFDTKTVLKSRVLECSAFTDKHTSSNISSWIDSVTKKFQIDSKICAVVTDDAANVTAAINTLKYSHISCFAHSLNCIVQEAITNNIKNLVEKIKFIVQCFKQSSYALSKLIEMQKTLNKSPLKLKQDVPTRWNSTYDMLKRFFLNKESIVFTLAILEPNVTIDSEEWDLMEHCSKILAVFNGITTEISSDKNLSLSKTSVLARIMLKSVKGYLSENKTLPSEIKNLGQELIEGLIKQFGEREQNELIAESVFLDPRFKKQGFEDNSRFQSTYQTLKTKIIACASHETRQHPQNSEPTHEQSISTTCVWEEFDASINQLQGANDPSASAIIELNKYLAELHIPRKSDPLIWWETRKLLYPNLYSIMIKRLCIPSSSVPCERIFSKAGNICDQKRNLLDTKKISQILVVNNNLDLVS